MNIDSMLQTLSSEQRRAVETTEGNVRLVAGAGSGKTNTLTKRVAYLCETKGITPDRILSVTFTNKAAEEMKQRVADYMQISADNLNMMTFHRLALNICKKDLALLGFPTVTDADGNEEADVLIGSTPLSVLAKKLFDDNADMLKELSKEEREFFQSKVIKYANTIVKSHDYVEYLLAEDEELSSPAEVIEYGTQKDAVKKQKDALDNRMGAVRKAIKEDFGRTEDCYNLLNNLHKLQNEKEGIKVQKVGDAPTLSWAKALIRMKAATKVIDFDDIIMFAKYLLENYEDVRTYWQNKYAYIQVDEFQDTDWTQLAILKILSEKCNGLFVVGDPDQSIYMFRGVKPEVFNTLDEHLDNLQTIYMQDNYRSSEAVIKAATAVIELNKNRLPKELKPKSNIDDMKAPLLCVGSSQYSAAQLEMKQIEKMISNGVNPNDICVLYRDKNCKVTEELVGLLKKNDIPLDCQFKATSYAGSFEDAVLYLLKYRYSKNANFLGNFIDSIFGEGYDKVFDTEVLDNMALDWNTVYAYIDMIYPKRFSKTGNPTGKYKKFVEATNDIQRVVSDTIEDWNALTDKEKQDACSEDSILNGEQDMVDGLHIMTIHKSKGLEFDYVFCNSMDDGMCPKHNSFMTIDSLEEDVRLAYVAITRAKKQVYLGFEKMESMSPFVAQTCLAIEPIHAPVITLPDKNVLESKVAEFNSVLDCYYMIKVEGIYQLMYNDVPVGYRYAVMLDGSRVYFQTPLVKVSEADAIPAAEAVIGQVRVAGIDENAKRIISYEEINKTVPVIDVTNVQLVTDLFKNMNPIRAIKSFYNLNKNVA